MISAISKGQEGNRPELFYENKVFGKNFAILLKDRQGVAFANNYSEQSAN